MTYQELKLVTLGMTLPLVGKNVDDENVIIEHRTVTQEGTNYFRISTAQNNGWTRINRICEDGTHEELYQK